MNKREEKSSTISPPTTTTTPAAAGVVVRGIKDPKGSEGCGGQWDIWSIET
jgi:hypothetical protein